MPILQLFALTKKLKIFNDKEKVLRLIKFHGGDALFR